METCYLSAHAFSGAADLLHGPFALIDEDRPVVVVAPEGVGGELLRSVLALLRERGVDTCGVGAPALGEEYGARTILALPAGLDESLSPLVQIAPLQWLVLEMALSRGLNLDRPRGLSKMTQTR